MHQQRHPQLQRSNLFEGLRPDDLKDMVHNHFKIDQYRSKMGNDEDIIVVSFKLMDKFPAIDMMEFIEKGYEFVLDADMSTGEESDGKYSVFVEFQRDEKFPKDLKKLLSGLSKLCDHNEWYFNYFKDNESHKFDEENIKKVVPLDSHAYNLKVKEHDINDLNEFFDQGAVEVVNFDENKNIKFSKPFAGNLTLTLESFGLYKDLVESLTGAVQLDESSNSEVLFLEKYLGNYEIHKINEKFLIKNGDRAVIVSKKGW
jgi:hypothetical protein